jgi:phosphoribosylglycinamide formyltransferase-1
VARLKTAVLISGHGSNLQALIDACADPAFPAEICLVLSNKPGAAGLDRAKAAGLPIKAVSHREFADRESFEAAVSFELEAAGAELVLLAGFMRVLTEGFVSKWQDRLINIHPSLLPAFPGLDTHARALEAGVAQAGCTVHFVRADVDAGPTILQAAVSVTNDDTEESLAARVLEQEHKIYPEALRLIADGKVTISDGKVIVEDA